MAAFIAEFRARLFRIPGKGGWTFAPVPERHAPPAGHAWGRTPVIATVDGHRWKTSVWREKSGRTLLAVPKASARSGLSVARVGYRRRRVGLLC